MRYSMMMAAAMTLLACASPAEATSFKSLYRFQWGTDGYRPTAAPVADAAGNLYGTTTSGGDGAGCPAAHHGGCGTVYKIAADGTQSILHAFTGGSDGRYPQGGLVLDQAGNLYGSTQAGGSSECNESQNGCGTVFKIAADGAYSILHVFHLTGGDAVLPEWGLARDGAGNLYGVGIGGGAHASGAIFKIAAGGAYSLLHSFDFVGAPQDGANPSSLIADRNGNLYGTTPNNGGFEHCQQGCGTVFEFSRAGVFSTLHMVQENEGITPNALVRAADGTLYGTTFQGGALGYGTVFKLAPDGSFTSLHSFTAGTDGKHPMGALAMDKAGNIYGTTQVGGGPCRKGEGCGTVFKLAAGGTESILHVFTRGKKGSGPQGGIFKDKRGLLYGTTTFGGDGLTNGTVFRMRP